MAGMERLLDMALVGLLMTGLALVSSSRILHCIRIAAFQGLLVGLLPLFAALSGAHGALAGALTIAVVNIAVKSVLLPSLLARTARMADVRREVEPFIGYPASIMTLAVAVAASFWLCSMLPLPSGVLSPLAPPVALSSMFAGLFMIVSRKKALTQAIGFLCFENGIYIFGSALLIEQSLVVELGILLDVLVLIFVMGIAVFQISRGFDHIDSDRMTQLGDWSAGTEGHRK